MMIYTVKIQKAIKFSAKTHNHYQQQKRKGKEIPYITHPLTVGIILSLAGASEEVIMAGILHDVIEDSVLEKKVTADMLVERFGSKVADLVLSVTEQDKSAPWEERKKQALEHIKHFSHDSLLVKSADVISNMTELLDDYQRHQDNIFTRFHSSKEKVLDNQINVINAVINAWPENPLLEDLLSLAKELKGINAGSGN